MLFRKKPSQKASPAPRLLPLDAYPKRFTEDERDRVDARLRADFGSIPVEPGKYLDNENDPWNLGVDGAWTDQHGEKRSGRYTPIVSLFGPFTRVVAAPRICRCGHRPISHGGIQGATECGIDRDTRNITNGHVGDPCPCQAYTEGEPLMKDSEIPVTRVHATTLADLPVDTTVYSTREGGVHGKVVDHLSNGNVGISWDDGDTSTGPVHFGYWIDA